MKAYSGESGIVYQYYFLESALRRQIWGRSGTAYLFHVSSDRKNYFVSEVVVEDKALRAWEAAHGRALVDAEKYAAAKMRLFRAFDESPGAEGLRQIRVTAANIETLLEPLRLEE